MFKRLIGWITGRTERLREGQQQARLVVDEFQKLQVLVAFQSKQNIKRHDVVLAGILASRGYLKILVKRAEEEALGPIVYDISVNDLFILRLGDRDIIWKSDVSYFNDITPVRLVGVEGCGKSAIDRIMQWKRECVSRITQEQVVEAIGGQQS